MSSVSWGMVTIEGRQILHVANDAGRLIPVLTRVGAMLDVAELIWGGTAFGDLPEETVRRVLTGCGVPEADLPPSPTRRSPQHEEYFRW